MPSQRLVVFAHASEARGLSLPVDGPIHKQLGTGVGKVMASAALTRELAGSPLPEVVVLFGVCGAYPQRHIVGGSEQRSTQLRIGEVVMVGSDQLADEGVRAEDGFQPLDELGLGSSAALSMDVVRTQRCARHLGCPVVSGATVSTCSGTEQYSLELASRTCAQVETMEGAAIASVCALFSVPLIQVRAVSNFTGDRKLGEWDLGVAVHAVQRAVEKLVASGL